MNKGQEGEDFVNKLAFNSFLQFWCFPGPLDITGDNKEICDLLVVFDKVCIIISVKNYSFTGNYSRYFRKTTEAAIRQITGAERKLFGARPILLKHPDRKEELFEKDKIKEVIRVVVNLNDQVKYYQTSHFIDGKHFTIMDAPAWKSAVEELNTIPDFVSYIKARCNIFKAHPAFMLPREEYDFSHEDGNSLGSQLDEIASNGTDSKFTLVSGSELDLIAIYIKNYFAFPDSLDIGKTHLLSMNIDGEWNKYIESKGKEIVESVFSEGYFIDRMVKEMLIHRTNGHKIAKIFFSLNRIQRSAVSKHIHEYHLNCYNSEEPIEYNRTHYVGNGLNFILLYFIEEMDMKILEGIVRLSIIHHAYLHNFNYIEIGLLGISRNMEIYLFGYSNKIEVSDEDLKGYIEMFSKMGWKIL